MPEGTQSALTKISRAIDRGTLTGVTVSNDHGLLVTIPSRPPARGREWQPSDPALLAWFVKNFPGGRHRLARQAGHKPTRANRSAGLDYYDYQVTIERSNFLAVRYSTTHQHSRAQVSISTENLRLAREAQPAGFQPVLEWQWCCCSIRLSGRELAELGLPARAAAAR